MHRGVRMGSLVEEKSMSEERMKSIIWHKTSYEGVCYCWEEGWGSGAIRHLDGDGVVGSAFHSRVVCHDRDQLSVDAPDPGDDASRCNVLFSWRWRHRRIQLHHGANQWRRHRLLQLHGIVRGHNACAIEAEPCSKTQRLARTRTNERRKSEGRSRS